METYSSACWFAYLSKDKAYMAVSTEDSSTYITANPITGGLTLDTTVLGRFRGFFSDNNKYLAAGLNREVKVYRNTNF